MTAPTHVEMVAVARVTLPDGTTTTTELSTVDEDNVFAAHQLEYAEAAELTARIGQGIDHVEDLIKRAFLGRAWLVLGFDSWNDWVQHHFGGRRLIEVSREARQATIDSLRSVGMSNRAIATAIGVHERSVRRDVASGLESGAASAAPAEFVIGADGKRYPVRSARQGAADHEHECEVCGVDHPEADEDCPYLAGAFDPITVGPSSTADLPDDIRDGLFGPGARGGDLRDQRGADDDETDADVDADAEEVDSEVDPLPAFGDDPAAVATSITRQATGIVKHWMRISEDLDELPQLIDELEAVLPEWPTGAPAPLPAELAGDGTAALESVQRWSKTLPTVLRRWAALIERLDRMSR